MSIDRNCHGDPPACVKRISMPHPSNFHPTNVAQLKKRTEIIKQSWERKRDILLAFCGAVRTPLRKNAMLYCHKIKLKKWGGASGHKELCRFEDSDAFEQKLIGGIGVRQEMLGFVRQSRFLSAGRRRQYHAQGSVGRHCRRVHSSVFVRGNERRV